MTVALLIAAGMLIQAQIYTESKKYQYDPMFTLAVIMTESSFRKGQMSPKNAHGLMQVVPFVGADVAPRAGVDWSGTETLYEPVANIKVGTRHLFEQILKFNFFIFILIGSFFF